MKGNESFINKYIAESGWKEKWLCAIGVRDNRKGVAGSWWQLRVNAKGTNSCRVWCTDSVPADIERRHNTNNVKKTKGETKMTHSEFPVCCCYCSYHPPWLDSLVSIYLILEKPQADILFTGDTSNVETSDVLMLYHPFDFFCNESVLKQRIVFDLHSHWRFYTQVCFVLGFFFFLFEKKFFRSLDLSLPLHQH